MADYNDKLIRLKSDFEQSNRITKRSLYYDNYTLHIQSNLSDIDSPKDKINYLVSELSSSNNKITSIIGKNQDIKRKIIEIEIDVLRELLENHITNVDIKITNDDYNYYPDIKDDDFNLKIYNKLEFNRNKSRPLKTPGRIQVSKKVNPGFQRSSTQKFAKNFISPFTPYNGVLLFHEVGVGKTCAALGIAEGFRDYLSLNNKKILVLTPSETLIGSWKNEIFNVEKEIEKYDNNLSHNVQCTGNKYLREIGNPDYEDKNRFKRQVNKVINKYYEFMGYQKLANTIKKAIAKNTANRTKHVQHIIVDYIKERFSNTVIIMDEVHETRISDNKEKDKLVVPWLEMIARYAVNTKIILLSATPMYNISSEIVWLLNLLLLNDKRAPIEEHRLFKKNGIEFKDRTVTDYFIKKSQGYISYVRGEDPISFPIKIEPTGSSFPNSQFKILKGKLIPIKENEKTKIKTLSSPMSMWQFLEFSRYYNTNIVGIDDVDQKTGFPVKAVQASNIIFPNPTDFADGKESGDVSKTAFDRCFIKNSDKKYTIAPELKNIGSGGKSFLHRDNIGQFSAKFKTIIDSITECEGIVFIFSDYLIQGVLTLAMALEENGFNRIEYKNKDVITKNILADSEKSTEGFCSINNKYYSDLNEEEIKSYKKANYILLEGNTPKTELNQLVKEVRGEGSEMNKNGEYIKVILGSEVVKQGISFKNVREVHILEPWFHLNEMKQAQGRAVRRGSHSELKPEKRNVTTYLHIATHPTKESGYKGENIELVDEKTYRKAFDKLKNMAQVERLIKENAIDCQLNKNINYYSKKIYSISDEDDPFSSREIIDSKGLKRILELYDTDYSEKCNFTECDYTCNAIPEDYQDGTIDNSTFNIKFAEDDILLIKEYIKTLFMDNHVMHIDEIVFNINSLLNSELDEDEIDNFNNKFIYIALDELVKNKEVISTNEIQRRGYIIERGEYYLFQPKEIIDENIPVKYRYLGNKLMPRSFPISSFKISRKTVKEEQKKSRSLVKRVAKKEVDIKRILDSLNIVYTRINHRVIQQYNVYQKRKVLYPILPDTNRISMYLFHDYIDTNIDLDIKLILIEILKMNRDKTSGQLFNSSDRITKALMEYFYVPSWKNTDKLTHIIDEGHIDPTKINPNAKVIGVNWFSGAPSYQHRVFILDSSENGYYNVPQTQLSKYNHLKMKEDTSNSSGIYGYQEQKNQHFKFHLINKLDGKYNSEMESSKKTQRRGAVCGTAKGAKNKPELIDLIHIIMESMGIKRKSDLYNKKNAPKKTDKKNGKINLCEEIEILLRHRDSSIFYEFESTDDKFNKVSYNHRYFYRILEKSAIEATD